jgi:hypothetical protein
MLETKKCKECGADIFAEYANASITFSIRDGELIHETSFPVGENAYILFFCSNNREHDVGDIELSYLDEVEQEIIILLSEES